jgi:hypothetical protein
MSLSVVLARPHGPPHKMGPYDRLRFTGTTLFDGAGGSPIARHQRHSWEAEKGAPGAQFSRLEVIGMVKLHFERKAAEVNYGPFASVTMVNGVAYADGNVFAFQDAQQLDWYCTQDRQHWDTMTVIPA